MFIRAIKFDVFRLKLTNFIEVPSCDSRFRPRYVRCLALWRLRQFPWGTPCTLNTTRRRLCLVLGRTAIYPLLVRKLVQAYRCGGRKSLGEVRRPGCLPRWLAWGGGSPFLHAFRIIEEGDYLLPIPPRSVTWPSCSDLSLQLITSVKTLRRSA